MQRFTIVPELAARSRWRANQLDMLMGIDPSTGQMYSLGVEDALLDLQHALQFVRREDHPKLFRMKKYGMWLHYFPEIREGVLEVDGEDPEYLLLRTILHEIDVEGIHYIYHPESDWEQWHAEQEALLMQLGENFARRGHRDPALRHAPPLTTLQGPGKLIEEQFGFSGKIRRDLAIRDDSPALIANHLVASNGHLIDNLSARQLEELCYCLFKEAGWETELTPSRRDGGKDVIARKQCGPHSYIVYAEATTAKKMQIQKVQAFAAVIASDCVTKGYFVSTTYHSSGAEAWCAKSRRNVANVRLVDRPRLERLLAKISKRHKIVQKYF